MNNSKTSIEDMEEKQWNRNKKRLITQNKKLNTEIKKLQVDINDILSSQHDESDEIRDFRKRPDNFSCEAKIFIFLEDAIFSIFFHKTF